MKILITGGNGQLGNSIRKISADFPDHTYIFTDVEDLDITSEKEIESFFKKFNPDFCINCAGYTAVDDAENDKKTAFQLNAEAVKLLATVSQKYNCNFIHISTDYVFSGKSWQPYKETNTPDANSVYGRSKLEGETHVIDSRHGMIIRTSWLYSEYGANFFKTMLRLMNEKEELKVVFDQIGTPTYAGDLAGAIMAVISRSEDGFFKNGVYHYSDEGVTSWYDFTKEIAKLAGFKGKVHPVESSEFPRPAPRPPFSVLNKTLIKEMYNIEIPHWRESLEYCYKTYKTQKDIKK